jgi:hypothetical protein
VSARAYVEVSCDWPRCYARIDTHFNKATEARAWAAKQGWKSLAGQVDVCGSPEQAEKYSSYGPSWNGHAGRTDHAPVVKASTKGYVKLSCVCAWDYVAPYSWQPAGACSRDMVGHYWGEHVEEAKSQGEAAASAEHTEAQP